MAAADRFLAGLLVLLLLLVSIAPAQAFTAVSISNRLGYGYCYNVATEQEAASCATGYCKQYASDPQTCAIKYESRADSGAYSFATGNGHWGLGLAGTTADADRFALNYCGDGCSIAVRWTETLGMPEMATLPPLDLDDPAHTAVLIVTHGSGPENVADRCFLDHINVTQGMASAVAHLDDRQIDGLLVEVDPFCTPHKLGTGTSLKVELRKGDLRERVRAYRAQGVPASHIFIVGHSAGGWAALLLKMEEPSLFNAVIAAAPAFAGESATRSQWWWDRRNEYLQRMDDAPDLSALVFAFERDTFETPDVLGQLAGAENVEFVAVTGRQLDAASCPEWSHATFISDCFEGRWGQQLADYIAGRLD